MPPLPLENPPAPAPTHTIPAAAEGIWNRTKELWTGSRLKQLTDANTQFYKTTDELRDAQWRASHQATLAERARDAAELKHRAFNQAHNIRVTPIENINTRQEVDDFMLHKQELPPHVEAQYQKNVAHLQELSDAHNRALKTNLDALDAWRAHTRDAPDYYKHIRAEGKKRTLLRTGAITAGAAAIPAALYALAPAEEPATADPKKVPAANKKMAEAWVEHRQSKVAFQVSEFSGPLSMGSFKMVSSLPAMSAPAIARKNVGASRAPVDMSSSSFLTKRAAAPKSREEQQAQLDISRANEATAGVMTMLGGAGLGYETLPSIKALHSRTPLYHGTTEANANRIRQEGLKPGGDKGILDIVDKQNDFDPAAAKSHVYLAPNKAEAKYYALQAEGIAPALAENNPHEAVLKRVIYGQQWADQAARNPEDPKRIVEAEVPLWKDEIAKKRVVNPEVAAPYEEWVKPREQRLRLTGQDPRKVYDQLRSAVVLPELENKYIRGPHFQPAGIGEQVDHIRHLVRTDPKRLLPAAVGTAGTIGLMGAGAGLMYHAAQRKLPEPEPEPEEQSEGTPKVALAGMGTAIPTVRSPRSVLSQTTRVGSAGVSPTPGPSIASQVKPINMGKGSPVGPTIPGAMKS